MERVWGKCTESVDIVCVWCGESVERVWGDCGESGSSLWRDAVERLCGECVGIAEKVGCIVGIVGRGCG